MQVPTDAPAGTGLYLHIPFCTQRCVYCDFYFVTTQKSHVGFVEALCTEIAHYAHDYGERPIETIYFGGGTPSLLTLGEVARILQQVHTHFDTGAVAETTLELNPDDADPAYLRGLRSLGIDRLSIGVQSFFEEDLDFMNRSHSLLDAVTVVEKAREAGFENFSVDLIFGLPDQPAEYWAANLEKVVAMEVPHLSTYSLTVEPRTPLAKQVALGHIAPAPEDDVAEQFQFTMDYLRAHGYAHYEISSFARPGFRARHNQLYWNHSNYLGFGPSAHSFWWRELPSPLAVRWGNVRNLRRYEALLGQRRPPLEFREPLSYDQLADEYIMLRLRTDDGIDLDRLEKTYGADLLFEKVDELARLEAEGYIHPIRNSRIRLSDKGKQLCDAVTAKLLLDA